MTAVVVPASPPRPQTSIALLIPAAIVIAAHGVIHVMGAVVLWRLGEPGDLTYADMSPEVGSWTAIPAGFVWIAAALVFVVAAVGLLARRRSWWWFALGGVILSLPVVVSNAQQAGAGIAVDSLLLAVLGAVMVLRTRR